MNSELVEINSLFNNDHQAFQLLRCTPRLNIAWGHRLLQGGQPVRQGYREGKKQSKACLHLKRGATPSGHEKLNGMEFLFGWLLGEGRGEGQPGDWNECHSASMPCLYGTVTSRWSTLLARSVLPSVFMEAENRCGEGKEQWLVWCLVQRLVPRLILLSLHHRHPFPWKGPNRFLPQMLRP